MDFDFIVYPRKKILSGPETCSVTTPHSNYVCEGSVMFDYRETDCMVLVL